MKIFKGILMLVLTAAFVVGCDSDGYIDPITPVDPGPDQQPPEVSILYPVEGTQIRVTEEVTPIDIRFDVEDDIEVSDVRVLLDGNEIATFDTDNFIDYRHFINEFTYETLASGQHTLTVTATDIAGKSTSESVTFEKIEPYTPIYGEVFYMPFDGDYMELVSITNPTIVGNPGFAGEGRQGGNAYKGAEGSYLTIPTDILNLEDEFSAVFWMKVMTPPDRAGILVIGPPDPNNAASMNNRTSGFRFFREGSSLTQRFKLNVGTGSSDSWFDGGAAADVVANTDQWVHFAFTISETEAKVYINGNVVSEGNFPGVSWENTDILSIMSGAPRFTGWNHLSDQGVMDELRIFNRELTQEEIQQIIADES